MSELLPLYLLIGGVFIPLMVVAFAAVLRFGPRRGFLNQPAPGFQQLKPTFAQAMWGVALLHVVAGMSIPAAFNDTVGAAAAGFGVAAMGFMYVAFGAVNSIARRSVRT